MKKLIFLITILIAGLVTGCSSSSGSSPSSSSVRTSTLSSSQKEILASIDNRAVVHNKEKTTAEYNKSNIDDKNPSPESIKLGDTVTIRLNTSISDVKSSSGEIITLKILNDSQVTITNILAIKKGNAFILGKEDDINSKEDASYLYEIGNEEYQLYSKKENVLIDAKLAIILNDDSSILYGGLIKLIDIANSTFDSHDAVSCREHGQNIIMYATDGTNYTSSQETKSGYAEIIMYFLSIGGDADQYYKYCY